jgi:hypothetical protein
MPLRPSTTDSHALGRSSAAGGLEGPRICFFNEALDYCYPGGGYCPCPETEVPLEVGAGEIVAMNWSAEPQPGAAIRAYRWALDIEDVLDETPRVDEQTDFGHWSAWSATTQSVQLGPWNVGEQHRLYVDVGDDLGLRSLGIVRFEVVAPTQRPPDCGAAVAVPATLWPPDHRLAPVRILGVTDPDGDPVAIRVTRVTQDEPPADPPFGGPGATMAAAIEGAGNGGTIARRSLAPDGSALGGGRGRPMCPDAVIGASGGVKLRAERLGTGNGRVYTLWFTASDPGGASCDGSVQVCVPHSRRQECADDGQRFDALGPCRDRGRGRQSIDP